MTNNRNKILAHVALISVAIIYGVNYIVARGVMVSGFLEPNVFILLRVVATLFLFFALHQRGSTFTRREHVRLFFCGMTGVAINQLFFFNGLKLSGPIQASLIMTTTPVLVYFLSLIILKQKFLWHKGLGIVLGIIGAGLIIYKKSDVLEFEHEVLGNALIFVNALSYAFYLVIVKPLMILHPPVQVLKWIFFYGLLFVLPVSIRPALEVSFEIFDQASILAIAYVVFVTTYVAYRLNGFALSKVNPTLVSVYMYGQPLVAAIVSIFLGIEMLTGKKVLAAVLIFASILFVSWQKAPKSR